MTKKGVLLCGHGTRMAEGVQDFHKFAEGFQNHIEGYETTAAFLELSEPDFDTGVKKMVDKGVTEIIALPLFLFTGIHIQKDIPCMLYKAAQKYNVSIKMGNYMGVCDEMVSIAEKLIREAASANFIDNPKETALVVAGVGSSRVQANADITALTRLIQERFRFAFATVGFLSKMTFPPLKETMQNIGLLHYKNVVILPYFFFTGIYMSRAAAAMKKAIKKNPEKQFVCTELLASRTELYDLLEKRMHEVLSGEVDIISTIAKEELENYHGHGHHHHGHHHHEGHCKH